MGKPFCPEGGRFMLEAEWPAAKIVLVVIIDLLLEAHKPPSYFDVAPKLYDANPPPGSYDARGTSLSTPCRPFSSFEGLLGEAHSRFRRSQSRRRARVQVRKCN